MEKIKTWVMSLLLKKYALGYMVSAYKFVKGYKTQISTVLAVAIYVGKMFGFIPAELADQLILILSGFGGASFMAKMTAWEKQIKEVATMVKDEEKSSK